MSRESNAKVSVIIPERWPVGPQVARWAYHLVGKWQDLL